jgi:voltage-gated potassium channel
MLPLPGWVRDAFHRPGTAAYRWTQGAIWALILGSVGLFALEIAVPGDFWRRPWLRWVDRAILGVFALELTLRVWSWEPPGLAFYRLSPVQRAGEELRGRLRYLLEPLNLVDLFTVLALVPALRGLRALRLLRLLRAEWLFRYSNPFVGLTRAFQENRLLFLFGQSLLGLATLVGGITIYLVERSANPHIETLADGFWWAIVTLTTVGFGDISPVTGLGRIVGAFLMVAGMFLLALFAGIVGTTLVHAVLGVREESFRMSATVGHVVILGYDPGAAMLLEAIEGELRARPTEIVILADSDRPKSVPPRFGWVEGDPTKESELDKVRVDCASTVVVVGSRRDTPQKADAVTLLTLFTLRSWLGKRKPALQRAEPLYVVAEILDQENVDHARAAGADEVIETTRLGFALIAHAVTEPGTGTILSKVASAGSQSLYVGCWRPPPGTAVPERFEEWQQRVKASTGALIIGVRERGGIDQVNPESSCRIAPGTPFIYLAAQPVLDEPEDGGAPA